DLCQLDQPIRNRLPGALEHTPHLLPSGRRVIPEFALLAVNPLGVVALIAHVKNPWRTLSTIGSGPSTAGPCTCRAPRISLLPGALEHTPHLLQSGRRTKSSQAETKRIGTGAGAMVEK